MGSKKLKSIERINYTNNFLQQFVEGQVISQISKNHEIWKIDGMRENLNYYLWNKGKSTIVNLHLF